eukprot:GFKZ01006648.1.p1 GENE.GFKZ01006648.1~~GFKZ01006648.1.p1  ORF type:complete len:442 (-),score=30.85 GFKZ01006648.1:673-1998(-)
MVNYPAAFDNACGQVNTAPSMSSHRQLRAAFLATQHTTLRPRCLLSPLACAVSTPPTFTRVQRAPSSFTGHRLVFNGFQNQPRVQYGRTAKLVTMIVDPWSVSPETVDALAAQFFAASLAPYLVFLYFLGKEETKCPPLANFGFRFLLVFVFATIPAGIYAKVHYHDILANIDWLHGTAESFLTITNLLIVLGFRNSMASSQDDAVRPQRENRESSPAQLRAAPTLLLISLATNVFATLSTHAEPANALSFQTWVIHVSSIVEWLVAMGLVWQYADITRNPRWKGLTWGMLPLHTSGICACTYHFFYNAPNLNILVAVQAALTCFGNTTMAVATYRLSRADRRPEETPVNSTSDSANISLIGFEDMAARFGRDSNLSFLWKVLAISLVGSAAVKWGPLFIDAPFEHSLSLALSIIVVPTLLNMAKWAVRSKQGSSDFGGFL